MSQQINYFIKLLTLSILCHSVAFASEQSYFSIKLTSRTPIADNFFTPKDLVNYKSSQFKELMYISPENDSFSIQASALIGENNDVNNLRALFSYKGIVITGSSGSIKGNFQRRGDAYFPGENPPDRLFNTLLPSDIKFNGRSETFGIGKPVWQDIILGFGYQKTTAPHFLSVTTHQTRAEIPRGKGSYQYDNSQNYYPQGVYPNQVIDAEGQSTIYGLWLRYDPVVNAFNEVIKTKKPVINYFFFYDAILGNFEYTPGNNVTQDYADATEQTAELNGFSGEGTTLKVYSNKSNFINLVSNYGIGVQAVYPFLHTVVGISGGFESSYSSLDDYTVNFSSGFGNESGAEAGLKETGSKSSYGFFIRFAVSY